MLITSWENVLPDRNYSMEKCFVFVGFTPAGIFCGLTSTCIELYFKVRNPQRKFHQANMPCVHFI